MKKIGNSKHIKMNVTLKGSSLVNAVFVCAIISVLSGCFILISFYQNMLNDRLSMQEDLIRINESAIYYALGSSDEVLYDEIKEISVFENGISSFIKKKRWGFYDVLISKTVFKNDTVKKTILIGETKSKEDDLALYVTDYDKPLKLSGETKVLGNLRVPNGRFEHAYINGQKGNTLKITGRQLHSKDRLPKIEKDIDIDVSGLPRLSLNSIEMGAVLSNSFDKVTKVINLSDVEKVKNITCKGNIILYSVNTLEIDGSTKLNDVVIMAPVVKINSGFVGNAQIVANHKVIMEEKSFLMYPSSIYVKNDGDMVSVEIKKKSKLIGGVVIDGDMYSDSLDRKLYIDEDALVVGNVYCYGSTQLKGHVVGSIYTDRFFLKTDASNYENVILNGTVDSKSLPAGFVELPLFNNDELTKRSYAMVKKL